MDGDDRDLLERIQHGDAESFGILCDRTRGWLLDCVITPRVGRADDACGGRLSARAAMS